MFTRFARGPEVFALIAAVLNGTIGPLTRVGLGHGLTPTNIAFWKCFGAFVLIASYCCARRTLRDQTVRLASRWPVFALLALLGIFCLYAFETWAFAEASIPLVSFLTYAAGGVTIVLSTLVLKEQITRRKVAAFGSIVAGVALICLFDGGVTGSYLGVALALCGGLGYALFIFLSKLWDVGSGLPQLTWLFGFGSLYLLLLSLHQGFAVPVGWAWAILLALILLPTIGGFYFTTLAISHGEASKVQIIETSDPLFATLFAFACFGDMLGGFGALGAVCIVAGLLMTIVPRRIGDLVTSDQG
ncbi:membrane protein [Pandoraea iniqua]|uniref:Membrane protein n=1 Tax=Pandoraea iniqua TaxID=2508288 RepID=A0A5E4RSZ0_9BURK|nr:membrane protein [Pandoraea iniqua]